MKRKVLIIYTGGTIGMEKDYRTGSLVPFDFEGIISKIPEIRLLDCEVEIKAFPEPLDSSDVGPQDWQRMAQIIGEKYEEFDGFLILHGTDTMAFTASALSFMLKGLRKPVILTGSQLPIGDLRTDAKENLLTGLSYASLYENDAAVVQEVAIYFEYKLLRGNRTMKFSAEYFDAYQSPNFPTLGQSGVHLTVHRDALLRTDGQNFSVDGYLADGVLFWRIFPGMDFTLLEQITGVKVLILQVFGSGTISSDPIVERVLTNLRSRMVEIVIISQCVSGGVTIGKYENSNLFTRIGAISGGDMTAEAALAKGMHLYGNPNYEGDFRTNFSQNLCGEITV